jgi:hypothetical protein
MSSSAAGTATAGEGNESLRTVLGAGSLALPDDDVRR